jgi:hypothetical protein
MHWFDFLNYYYFIMIENSKRGKGGSSELSSLDLDKISNSYPYCANTAGSLLTEPPCPSSPQHGKELEDNKVRLSIYLEPIFSFEGLYFCAVICPFHI